MKSREKKENCKLLPETDKKKRNFQWSKKTSFVSLIFWQRQLCLQLLHRRDEDKQTKEKNSLHLEAIDIQRRRRSRGRERARGKKRELLIFHLTLFNKKKNAEKRKCMLSYTHTHTYVKQPCTEKQKWWLELLITIWTIINSM